MKKLYSILLIASSVLSAQTETTLNYLQYDTEVSSPALYKARRDSLMRLTGNNAVIILYSAPERIRNADVDYQYRQSDNFYYLTGFTEPNAVLMMCGNGISVKAGDSTISVKEILFVQSRNPMMESWTGRRYGTEEAVKLLGMEYALTNDMFKKIFSQTLFFSQPVYLYAPPITSDCTGEIREIVSPIQNFFDNAAAHQSAIEFRDVNPLVRKMRIIKSPEEIALIRKATEISALAHNQAMMSCEPGMHEYELQAVYEYVFKKLGAEYTAYPCIVGAGENSVILHYESNRKKINSGEIIAADCAAEYHGYASDITRTFPAGGKFSKEQKEIYQIVLSAQKATINAVQPGAAWARISTVADSVIESGLFDLGIIREKGKHQARKFFPHGLGHPVGLNVHDVGKAEMEPGMIYTVEPGIYIPEGSVNVDPKYFNIGVRIEDVVLVTPNGHEVLSAGTPKEISEIEALMKKKGIGNLPVQ